jgi:hypothetical protein
MFGRRQPLIQGPNKPVEIACVKGSGIKPESRKKRGAEDAVRAWWKLNVASVTEHEPVESIGVELEDHVFRNPRASVILLFVPEVDLAAGVGYLDDQLRRAGDVALRIDPAPAACGSGKVKNTVGLWLGCLAQDYGDVPATSEPRRESSVVKNPACDVIIDLPVIPPHR